MIRKLKTLILSLSAFFMLAVPMVAVSASAATSSDEIQGGLKCGSNINLDNITEPKNCEIEDSDGSNLTTLAKKIINILSVLVGAIAVIMIIIGGFRYVTSGGNDSNVASAKNTILYAIIGLVIVAIAQIVVHFVLANIT